MHVGDESLVVRPGDPRPPATEYRLGDLPFQRHIVSALGTKANSPSGTYGVCAGNKDDSLLSRL
jgi:hypothetical protein